MKATLFLALALLLAGCGSGDPEPTVGDNPAAANGRKAEDAATPEQKARRAKAPPQGSPW